MRFATLGMPRQLEGRQDSVAHTEGACAKTGTVRHAQSTTDTENCNGTKNSLCPMMGEKFRHKKVWHICPKGHLLDGYERLSFYTLSLSRL